jgi:hypothetical protein
MMSLWVILIGLRSLFALVSFSVNRKAQAIVGSLLFFV